MKILTLYYSQSGQTEKIAKAIHSCIPEKFEKKIGKIADYSANDLDEFDLVFIGGPCHSSDLAKPLKQFLEDLKPSPKYKLAGFYTHGSYPPEREGYEEVFERWVGKCALTFDTATTEKKIALLGYFRCMGNPSPPVLEFIKENAIPSEKEFNEYVEEVRNRPNTQDIENAQKFAQKILEEFSK